MNAKPYHVLFLCTANSARSILAEAVLNGLGDGRFIAHSAGSMPRGRVHPMALTVLAANGYAVAGLRSKSWDEFGGADAPVMMDFVFTVCDNAANELCPIWPGQPISAHWGMAIRRGWVPMRRNVSRLLKLRCCKSAAAFVYLRICRTRSWNARR